jgi:hypothetical protein
MSIIPQLYHPRISGYIPSHPNSDKSCAPLDLSGNNGIAEYLQPIIALIGCDGAVLLASSSNFYRTAVILMGISAILLTVGRLGKKGGFFGIEPTMEVPDPFFNRGGQGLHIISVNEDIWV